MQSTGMSQSMVQCELTKLGKTVWIMAKWKDCILILYIIIVYKLFVPLSLMYVPAGQNWILYPSRSPSRHPRSKAHLLQHKPWWKDCWNRVHCSRIHSGLTQQPVHLHAMYACIIFPEGSWHAIAMTIGKPYVILYIHYQFVLQLCEHPQKHTHIYIIILYYNVLLCTHCCIIK